MGTSATAADRLEDAIRDAQLGAVMLGVGADLIECDGLELATDGSGVRATVTLPIPDAWMRSAIETDLRSLAESEGIALESIEWAPSPTDPGHRVDLLPEVANVLAVASGKGGVGKSTIAVNLAAALASTGASVGLLDADIYGPNVGALLGLDNATPEVTAEGGIVPREAHGVRAMSMAFVVDEDDPVIWRGPMVDDALEQLLGDVAWGALDYLIVDLPPGTGDAQLSLVDRLPLAGAVIVTTPQAVAVDDARRGLEGFAQYDVPILGIAENLAGFRCPDCGTDHDVFSAGGAASLAEAFEVPVVGRIPIDPAVGTLERATDATRYGVEIPGLGRIGLPRTGAERAGSERLPPIVLREDGATATAFRELAARTAARVNLAATAFP